MTTLRWQDSAACIGADTAIFFPESGDPVGPAKALCRACPVREQCLADALERGEVHGVWGGLSAKERRKYRRQHGLLRKPGGQPQPINHGTNGGYHAHRRRGQQPCDACSRAHIRYVRARREGGDAA